MHIGYKAGVGTKKNWPYNQYGLISDVTMEGPGTGLLKLAQVKGVLTDGNHPLGTLL